VFRIQKRKWKNRDGSTTESWRLIIEDYTGTDRVCHYPARDDYARYGFSASDTYDQALEKLKTVRAQAKVQRDLEQRAKIERRIKADDVVESAFVPRQLYRKFVKELCERRMWTDGVPDKSRFHLNCMRRMLLELKTCPSKLSMRPELVYNWFYSKSLSLSYIQKVLPLLNDYGFYYCDAFGKSYRAIKSPKGLSAQKIDDKNFDERGGKTNASKPLELEHLAKLDALPDPQRRWVMFSFYFGLRPSEVDALKPISQTKTWGVNKDQRGTPVLAFYQKKLVKIDRERRWKRIPAILPEQVKLLQEIAAGREVKRPYSYVFDDLGEGFGLYAGRKGFEKLMRELGQSEQNISRWLGHQTIQTTEKHYREIGVVSYDPLPDAAPSLGKTPVVRLKRV
jgi:integrase